MPRTTVVLLSAFLSPYRSGAEAMVEEVAVRLPGEFDVTIVTARLSRDLPSRGTLTPSFAKATEGRPHPSPAHSTGSGQAGRGERRQVLIVRVGFGFGFDKYLFPFLVPFAVRRLRPDIVHAVLESYAGLALVFCRFFAPRAKRILTLQSTNTSFLLGPMHRSADRITAISSVLVERAKTFGRSDVTLIPNGIDVAAIRVARCAHAKDCSCVLFVGRLEAMKGVDMLLRAFAKAIVGLSPDIHLRIVGDGSLKGELTKLSQELEIDHRVAFIGRVSPTAVFDEYAKAEIFCGLSRSEALGNVFLEAQAAGCAVLATKTGGIPEIVQDGVSGLLVPVDNVDAAAAALKNLLLDPSLRGLLASGGKKSAEKYDWDEISGKYGELYDRV